MDAWALGDAERALLAALDRRGVRYLLVGLSAALLEGADVATQDLDLWLERTDEDSLRTAAREAGGFWASGAGVVPAAFGGPGLDRIDLVLGVSGLQPFDVEYAGAHVHDVDGLKIHVLPIERVLASKRAANRPKDRAHIPALEAAIAARANSGV